MEDCSSLRRFSGLRRVQATSWCSALDDVVDDDDDIWFEFGGRSLHGPMATDDPSRVHHRAASFSLCVPLSLSFSQPLHPRRPLPARRVCAVGGQVCVMYHSAMVRVPSRSRATRGIYTYASRSARVYPVSHNPPPQRMQCFSYTVFLASITEQDGMRALVENLRVCSSTTD
jgi:hypothetical protein